MPKIELWKSSSQPVKIEYILNQAQKSVCESEKSTENETEQTSISSASRLLKTYEKPWLQKKFST